MRKGEPPACGRRQPINEAAAAAAALRSQTKGRGCRPACEKGGRAAVKQATRAVSLSAERSVNLVGLRRTDWRRPGNRPWPPPPIDGGGAVAPAEGRGLGAGRAALPRPLLTPRSAAGSSTRFLSPPQGRLLPRVWRKVGRDCPAPGLFFWRLPVLTQTKRGEGLRQLLLFIPFISHQQLRVHHDVV